MTRTFFIAACALTFFAFSSAARAGSVSLVSLWASGDVGGYTEVSETEFRVFQPCPCDVPESGLSSSGSLGGAIFDANISLSVNENVGSQVFSTTIAGVLTAFASVSEDEVDGRAAAFSFFDFLFGSFEVTESVIYSGEIVLQDQTGAYASGSVLLPGRYDFFEDTFMGASVGLFGDFGLSAGETSLDSADFSYSFNFARVPTPVPIPGSLPLFLSVISLAWMRSAHRPRQASRAHRLEG